MVLCPFNWFEEFSHAVFMGFWKDYGFFCKSFFLCFCTWVLRGLSFFFAIFIWVFPVLNDFINLTDFSNNLASFTIDFLNCSKFRCVFFEWFSMFKTTFCLSYDFSIWTNVSSSIFPWFGDFRTKLSDFPNELTNLESFFSFYQRFFDFFERFCPAILRLLWQIFWFHSNKLMISLQFFFIRWFFKRFFEFSDLCKRCEGLINDLSILYTFLRFCSNICMIFQAFFFIVQKSFDIFRVCL